ncbi:hypothetical protein B0H17DRAFT_1100548 [Mycena rosella]|uniref:DUF6534 domain-containing protein n=1 Tax=Mycena rosella TaxID=1033263 RepID=A0AAD7CMP0_MYCRO|nr:hypothetical protein B0H17DRAFT_1100548 [Mycena rosella]
MDNRPAKYLLGPLLIGTCISLVFQGVLSTQFVNYFGTFRTDPVRLKVAVGILALLTYLNAIHLIATQWIRLILHFGDFPNPVGSNDPLPIEAGIVLAAIPFLVQIYFCVRLHMISKKLYIAVPIGVLAPSPALPISLQLLPTKIPQGFPELNDDNIYLPTVMVCFSVDIVLACSIAYFLIKSKRDISPQTVGLINALIRLAIQTAAPATICALIDFVISLAFPEPVPASRAVAAGAVQAILPSFYAFSMMWTLNERTNIRAEHLSYEIDGFAASGFDFAPDLRNATALSCLRFQDAEQAPMSQTTTELGATSAGKQARFSIADSDTDEIVFAPAEPKRQVKLE